MSANDTTDLIQQFRDLDAKLETSIRRVARIETLLEAATACYKLADIFSRDYDPNQYDGAMACARHLRMLLDNTIEEGKNVRTEA